MDHNEAVRLQAATKYLCGELTRVQRDEYEEHYFDCPECAQELKASVAFMESAKQVVREHSVQTADSKGFSELRTGWLAWLRPAFAVPVFAALVLVVAYQNAVTIPKLKQTSSRENSAEAFKSLSLIGGGSRGGNTSAPTIAVRPDELFALDADMPGNSADGYVCQVADQSGHSRLSVSISAEEAKNTVHVKVPAGVLEPGKYNFVIFRGKTAANGANAVSQLPFAVELQR